MTVEMLFGALGVNAAAILAAYMAVTMFHADAITVGEIKYRMRCLQQRPRYMRLEFPKTGYLQSLRIHIRGTVSVPADEVGPVSLPLPLVFLEGGTDV